MWKYSLIVCFTALEYNMTESINSRNQLELLQESVQWSKLAKSNAGSPLNNECISKESAGPLMLQSAECSLNRTNAAKILFYPWGTELCEIWNEQYCRKQMRNPGIDTIPTAAGELQQAVGRKLLGEKAKLNRNSDYRDKIKRLTVGDLLLSPCHYWKPKCHV